jgi:predicted NodU family carbamoyl transferase
LYYHDSAPALLNDGKIVSVAQEERFFKEKIWFGISKTRYSLLLTVLTADKIFEGIILASIDYHGCELWY